MYQGPQGASALEVSYGSRTRLSTPILHPPFSICEHKPLPGIPGNQTGKCATQKLFPSTSVSSPKQAVKGIQALSGGWQYGDALTS